ncbi:hypothetical protein [Azotobacter vinelandii]|uniref:hypothetical protein n=1 Tax=Azotobacter vinelandii TaxID=354 RepID=UPI002665BDCD|nr:hypothetical protein [Azotobacter vinelandii]WKN24295.1 hypothetical protein AVAEIV_002451 [Azotobacter vinelandii]
MSGITPLLDTLLHQVLGKPVDLPVEKPANRPVEPVVPGEAVRALDEDARLDARVARSPAAPLETPRQDERAAARRAPAAGPDSAAIRLSPAARAIADALLRQPERPAAIAPAAPLLPAGASAPAAALLAGLLRQSIGESGLFYEAHLARWYRGELPLQALAREPQMAGWQPPTEAPPSPPRPGVEAAPAVLPAPAAADAAAADEQPPATAPPAASGEATRHGPALEPEQAQGLVRQQLELLANPSLRWQGEVWPGLFMSLSLQAPEAQRRGSSRSGEGGAGGEGGVEEERWSLRLDLRLPDQGDLQVEAWLDARSLSLTLSSDSPAVLEYFARDGERLRERIAECFPGEIALRCVDARRSAEAADG